MFLTAAAVNIMATENLVKSLLIVSYESKAGNVEKDFKTINFVQSDTVWRRKSISRGLVEIGKRPVDFDFPCNQLEQDRVAGRWCGLRQGRFLFAE